MSTPSEHTHHIKIRSTQMEIPSGGGVRDDDYDQKLRDAEAALDRIQLEHKELARQKSELEELTGRKRTFLTQQAELTEKLSIALTLTDRELSEMRKEAEELEQCRVAFASHLEKINKYNPENWSRENQSEKLERATMALDIAADEYDQAANYFISGRCASIFGKPTKRGRSKHRRMDSSEFMVNLRNGFAFNLPIVALGGVALFIYLVK